LHYLLVVVPSGVGSLLLLSILACTVCITTLLLCTRSWSYDEKPAVEKCGIVIEGQDKWKTVISEYSFDRPGIYALF
ncbi:MAG: hypothetical protein WCC17_18510, partial [Candidatus Nitrosopolaris sp.]